jgi:hypothetical protein
MSTSATQSGTTTGARRSGKGLGFAAAALAVVIAAGFVFALNQGNQATVSNAADRAAEIAAQRYEERVQQLEAAYEASTRPNPAAEIERLNDLATGLRAQQSRTAEIDRLNDLALSVRAESHPGFNIEKTKMELAGQLVVEHPGVSPEKTRMEYLTEKLGEVIYVPSIVQAVGGTWSEGNLDLIRAQAKAQQPSELEQPEWDNRMP